MGADGASAMTGGMSREDRKNLEIAKMIERQEQLRKKREEKNKQKVSRDEQCIERYTKLTCGLLV